MSEHPKPIGGTRAITVAAAEVVCAVTKRRLDHARRGVKVCVPATLMRDLANAIETAYPGLLARTRATYEEDSE